MSQPVTQGVLKKTPCPYPDCRHPHDFSDATELLEGGALFNCDRCGRIFELAKVEEVTHLWVRPTNRRKGEGF